jgi:hypothetical protein
MADKSWKAFERRVARYLHGQRRGADFRSDDSGNDDVIHPHFSVECKLLGRPAYSDMLKACLQAERNAGAKEPIAVVKKKYADDKDALVIMRLEEFIKWRV